MSCETSLPDMTVKEVVGELVYGWKVAEPAPDIPLEDAKKLQMYSTAIGWDNRLTANIVGSANYYFKHDPKYYPVYIEKVSKTEFQTGLQKIYTKDKKKGIIGRGNTDSYKVYRSPTQTKSTPSRSEIYATRINEYKQIFLGGTLIDIGSGADFNLVAIAKKNIFQQTIGIDALSVEECLKESIMQKVIEANHIDEQAHLDAITNLKITHIKHDIRDIQSLPLKLSQLKRPIVVFFANFLMYYSHEVVRTILENVSGTLSPDFLIIYEGLTNQGLVRYPDNNYNVVCRLIDSPPIRF